MSQWSLNYRDVLKRLQEEQWRKAMEILGPKIRPWGRELLLILPREEDGDFTYWQGAK